MKKQIIYIAHPISGDVNENLKSIKNIYRYLSLKNKVIPFIPYIATIESLNDNNQKERLIGFSHNEAIFKSGIIDQLWLYGGIISEGMKIEIEWANDLGIPIITKF
ncbi:MAG: hypothetical protein H7098_07830 [Oligoflexus sp.]|nr:hypothetical protein [Pseudopedobacter sp.]